MRHNMADTRLDTLLAHITRKQRGTHVHTSQKETKHTLYTHLDAQTYKNVHANTKSRLTTLTHKQTCIIPGICRLRGY